MATESNAGALHGIRVLEFGDGVAVAYLGALLSACGASVIKIESLEGGDSVRRLPPFAKDAAPPESSGMHAFLNADKASIALDIDRAEASPFLHRLATDSELVLEGMAPGRMEALGLGHASRQASSPRTSTVSLSWFGQDGPRRNWQGSDAIAQALSGFIYPIGPPEGPPVIPGGFNAQITAGVTAFIPTLAAMIASLSGHAGVLIDQSILEAQTTYTETSGVRAAYDGGSSFRQGLNQFSPSYPQTIYPTADGWIGATILTLGQWRTCCEMLGAEELIEDPRFRTPLERSQNANELDPLLIPLFAKRGAAEWFHDAQARRVPLALVPTMEDMLALDHFRAREVLARYEHPDIGEFTAAAIPWKFAVTPVRRGGRAPRLGEQTSHVLRDLCSLDTKAIRDLQYAGIIHCDGRTA